MKFNDDIDALPNERLGILNGERGVILVVVYQKIDANRRGCFQGLQTGRQLYRRSGKGATA